jgi:hypothetical protein
MNADQFNQARHYLGKTQRQLSTLLCISLKAVQSFEQGWRNIPVSVERQLMLLLYLSKTPTTPLRNCWELCSCPRVWKDKCAAWEYGAGKLCWLVNGTFCQGEVQPDWSAKMETCLRCKLLQSEMPSFFNRLI